MQVSRLLPAICTANRGRIRRVKCGEEKPHCARCTSTGRKCDYAEFAKPAVARVLPVFSAVSRERRAYEYYFFHAAPSLSDALDLEFWRGTVLQICGSEPAVWDAVVALSAFYEHPTSSEGESTYQIERTDRLSRPKSRSHREALVWYSRSLSRIQDQIKRGVADYAVALVSCVLFICIEVLQGNVKSALMLYHQATQLMASATESVSKRLETTIAAILLRVGTISVIVDGNSPLPKQSLPSSHTFTRLSDARSALYALVADWKKFDLDCLAIRTAQRPISDADYLRPRQRALERDLLSWDRQFQTLPEVIQYNRKTNPSSEHRGIIAALSMTYLSILTLTRTGLSTSESCYDAYEADFAKIISHTPAALSATTASGNQPPFTFDMGTGMSLLITIMKCRSPTIRRQALKLLRQSPERQGMYFSKSASSFLAAVVAVEETGGTCSEEQLSVHNLLNTPGRVPLDNERLFALELIPWETPDGGMGTALQYARRETVGGEMRVVNDMVVRRVNLCRFFKQGEE